jgi:sec-independent protein translocase protein TatA
MFGMPGGVEWVIILVIVLVIFGGGKLAGVGKSLGTAISEFKDAVKSDPEEDAKNANKAQSAGSGSEGVE